MPTIPKPSRPPWMPERKAYESGRKTKRWAGYATHRWKSQSALFKIYNPICSVEGCGEATYYTDHDIPVLQCRDPWDWSNWRPLCYHHGNTKTSNEGHEAKGDNNKGRGGYDL